MPPVTLEAIEARQTELAQLIQTFKQQAGQPILHRYPEADILLHPGERYAGPVLDEDGKVQHHLVYIATSDKKLNWQAAMDWASTVCGYLPTRQEQALLYANCKPHLKPEWHWSSETHADDASFAWHCTFYGGFQNVPHKSFEGSAVAVRRV